MTMKRPKLHAISDSSPREGVLDILELFASEPAGFSKSDVARRLGRTISEDLSNAIVSLKERGYISQSGDGERYRLTSAVCSSWRRNIPDQNA